MRTESLKFRADLQDRVMDSWSLPMVSNIVGDRLQRQIAKKNLQSKNQS